MSKKEKRAFESQMVRLMKHILKILIQPYKITRSWINSIRDARHQIELLRQKYPFLKNKNWLAEKWNRFFQKAKKEVEQETGEKCDVENLSEEEVFEKDYSSKLDKEDK